MKSYSLIFKRELVILVVFCWSQNPVDSIVLKDGLGFGKWMKPHLTWTIYRYPNKIKHPRMTYSVLRSYVNECMFKATQLWSTAIDLKFTQTFDDKAHIKVIFFSGIHDDGYAFDGIGGELAHTFYPQEARKGEIHVDDDEPWSPNGGRNLEWTLAHEMGHVLGIPHQPAPSLMQDGYRGYHNKPLLTNIDITAARKLY